MLKQNLDEVVSEFAQNYTSPEIFFTDPQRHFPNRKCIISILDDLRHLMFPRYFGEVTPTGADPKYFIGQSLVRIEDTLRRQVREALLFREDAVRAACADGSATDAAAAPDATGTVPADPAAIDARVDAICTQFVSRLPELHRMLLKDVQAAFDGDPAAQSKEEIIFSYPGFFATFVYRVAHELYVQDVPLIPRIMSEYVHSLTGVDINPGATIGEYFFIDHATGVVIGETTVIGNHVKIYQGVTLGALSTRAGQQLAGVKRHPTIEDNVTIYSNASVLGGETVIGAGSVIAGSAFVTESIPANSRVSVKGVEINVRQPRKSPASWEL